MNWLSIYSFNDVVEKVSSREGEVKVAQSINFLSPRSDTHVDYDTFKVCFEKGIRYVLVGISEDIGPRANCGRAGAADAWEAFLRVFLNMQSNNYLHTEKILLLGHIVCDDLMLRSVQPNTSLNDLRTLCSELDSRVYEVALALFTAQLVPVVIGGGHNNCFPLLKALSASFNRKVGAINLDPHADFRALEGRHSGNGFRYAYAEQVLGDYHVLGLNEMKNNQESLDALAAANFSFSSQQCMFHRSLPGRFDTVLSEALDRISKFVFGVELDADAISCMPVSAYNTCGVSVDTAATYVYQCALRSTAAYLHICEAAPSQHPAGLTVGNMQVGQVLALLTTTYIQTRSTPLFS